MTTPTTTMPRLKERYRAEIAGALTQEFQYGNPMQVPRLVKIVVNMGVGDAARDAKLMDGAVRDLTAITGQKPQIRRATKSIAQFKLREGMPIGAKVTLRGDRMWEFLDRLLSIAFPRIRDFRGLDGRKLDDQEIASHMSLLLIGGSETFPKVFANLARRLAEHPSQRAAVDASML